MARTAASIFISYASPDKRVAETLCAALEQRGLRCWLAFRDVAGGDNFAAAVVRAIRSAQVMLLVFTANTNRSDEVKKELVLASQNRLVVVPLRVEDVAPDDAFAYELATRQWIDMFDDWEHAMERVVATIAAVQPSTLSQMLTLQDLRAAAPALFRGFTEARPRAAVSGGITAITSVSLALAATVIGTAFITWLLLHGPTPPPASFQAPPPIAAMAPPVAAVAPPDAVAPPAAPPSVASLAEFGIETADETKIRDHVAKVLTLFSFAANPNILVLDCVSLREQGLMLNRVAALIEKRGTPRNRVLNDAELDQAIRAGGDTVETYYYGHDYSAAEVVRFFTLADAGHITLFPEEETLRRLLQQLGWFASGVKAAVISIPRAGSDPRVTYSARSAILHHELAAGEYFSNPAYAAFIHQFWLNALTPGERDGVRQYLSSEEYDSRLEELMENEMQAYLMFTQSPAFFTPAAIGMTTARQAELAASFLRGMPPGWLHDSLATPQEPPATAMTRQ